MIETPTIPQATTSADPVMSADPSFLGTTKVEGEASTGDAPTPPKNYTIPVEPVPTREEIPVVEKTEEVEEPKVEDSTDDTLDYDAYKKRKAQREGKTLPEELSKKPSEVKPTELQQTSTETGRDYTGYTPEETSLLKRMPNETFAYVDKQLKEARQAKAEIAELNKKVVEAQPVYNDPRGYEELPEYKDAIEGSTLQQQILAHWQAQYTKLQRGDNKWETLQPSEDGKGIIKVEVEAAPEHAAYLIDRMNASRLQALESSKKAESLKQNWETKSKEFPTFVQGVIQEQFAPILNNPESKKYMDTIANALTEKGQGRNPLTPLAGALYAGLMDAVAKNKALYAEMEKLQSVVKQKQGNAQAAKTIEPSPKPTSKVNAGSSNEDLADYEAFKSRYRR